MNIRQSPWWLWFTLVIAALFRPTPASGLGVRIPNQDPEAIARGNAFVATANNPAALYYNPAGITQLEGHNVQAGSLFYLGVVSEFEATDGSGRDAESEYEILPVPHLHYVFSPKASPLSFGLGVYSPFGLSVEWPDDTGFRTLAEEGRLTYVTLNPVIAYQVHPTLSLAAGPTFNYAHVKLRQGIGLLPGDAFKFEGDDFGFGFNAGVLWQPHPKWSFGAQYRSSTEMDFSGDSELQPFAPETGTSAELDFPQIVSAGISFRPTPRWNIEANVDWADWDSFDEMTFEGAVNPLTGQAISLPLNWESSWFYHFGASHYFENGYFLSAGYFFSENSTSEKHFNPIVPDTDLHVGSIGGGYKGDHWRWALAAQIITGPWREVSGSESTSLVGESADGRYRLFVPALSFSVGYHF